MSHAYLPIGDHGLIGNLRTAALVGLDGTIDWCCVPVFDAPSVFGSILDAQQGGAFRIAPTGEGFEARQVYIPDTNVLVTRFAGEDGACEVTDFMVVDERDEDFDPDGPMPMRLVRRVAVLRGSVDLRLECRPAFDYARADHTVTQHDGAVTFESDPFESGNDDGRVLRLKATRALDVEDAAVRATWTLQAGDEVAVELCTPDAARAEAALTLGEAAALQERTVAFWRGWVDRCTYTGRWREAVRRSALALKLMTFRPTGAIVAAPTASLPEAIGGARNFDYRFSWIRDASLSLYGLLRVGFTEEVRDYLRFVRERCAACAEADGGGPLQIVYGIDGRSDLTETTLDHLEGYRGSTPVRVGNAAASQRQLDIYGELLDAAYLFDKYGTPIAYDFWTELVGYLDWVCDHWDEPDQGIWEVRGDGRHFVFSKLMCWVALDRGIRFMHKRALPGPEARWRETRDALFESILEHGWSDERGAFVQHYGSERLDASNLIMPLIRFLSPTDPRFLATLDATLQTPEEGGLTYDCLVFRYDADDTDDGFDCGEGTFNLCSFWLIEALARAGQTDRARLDQAHLLFEKMLGYANHVGLYAEETGLRGEALGNTPQAFSHLGLISTAFTLDRILDGETV